ncbi:TRAP transporter small permease [Phaeobacter gallaeciensis]|uniref:TRAP transporter small permease protein n=1 Tax=Phaeobacter gallaeciensis TaxID=60890 RepID=A0AAC9ZEK5_9RHOB|nr:TRAP transporter small permease [Phaeobacter gallaeciensis]AHD11848.1 TRAP-type C4-dicarboxylate transport system, small permease component [Phaeobacter gallaeciensis DSM 26640]ATE95111.1 TRAP-type C4-dicarboxylate transport system, small permease component [Phaeobacter gallaeciensis]ATE99419.1 TRAP-type C4-dicarboxylate transport system, small permease component [Phaeobacter gallaeciensis]ATF03816.1 TRAP-type C4-dicarboxylate transport system, small permease component [Phaeobacter gallaecie
MASALAERISLGINRTVEAIVAALMVALVLDVWIGVVDRYWFHWQLPWPETLARYLMIWAAMLAVSSGIARREHIGLTAFLVALPQKARNAILICIDILALALFAYVLWFGIGFAQSGSTRQAMIFGATLEPFFWAIPASALLAVIQLVLVMLRDRGTQLDHIQPDEERAQE